MKVLFGDFNAEVGREDIFKSTIGNESIDRNSNDNGVRIVTLPHKNWLLRARCSRSETFTNTPGSLPLGRFTTRFITY
jgi:hypothetical protein